MGPETNFMHYSSKQSILLVGEGDFTFSSALASGLGQSFELIATSINSEGYIRAKYAQAIKAVTNLREHGARIIYDFDATKNIFSNTRRFHRVVFNFPHAGYFSKPEWVKSVIRSHQDLIIRFLLNASTMIRSDGEIHVTIQDYDPYNRWNIAELARECGLSVKGSFLFEFSSYPGYCNRRGSGKRPGRTFPVGRGCIRTYQIGY
ncbi:hypothetical protein Mapa_003251 [Marchantia paleacea]|nr:hypothetical protein Mapa_003251 [Marchantia paleacea]